MFSKYELPIAHPGSCHHARYHRILDRGLGLYLFVSLGVYFTAEFQVPSTVPALVSFLFTSLALPTFYLMAFYLAVYFVLGLPTILRGISAWFNGY